VCTKTGHLLSRGILTSSLL